MQISAVVFSTATPYKPNGGAQKYYCVNEVNKNNNSHAFTLLNCLSDGKNNQNVWCNIISNCKKPTQI